MKRNVLAARQVAARLGVKIQTVYAYVSRGALSRTLDDDGRTSLFDAAEVERLARHGRPRSDGARLGAVDVSLATAITEIHGDRLLFRGRDAVELARTGPFERVAELLWTGTDGHQGPWIAPPRALRVARATTRPLPPETPLGERLAVVAAALSCVYPLRGDLRPPAVTEHARALVTTFVEALPLVGRAPPGPGRSIAHRLFSRLSPLPARAAATSPELAVARALEESGVHHGFGHLVYRGVDPRAAHLLDRLDAVLRRAERRRIDEVLRAASGGSARPNVDFALGALAFAMQMPLGATDAVFVVARTAGWIAHALEEYGEAPLRFRARAVYIGPGTR